MFYLLKKKTLNRSVNAEEKMPGGLSRPLECCLVICGLLILSPVLLICTLLVRLSSAGPVLFRQFRIGRNGRVFIMYKFRTMVVAQRGPMVTAKNDHRITSVGKLLRKTKLDELPEFFNVLKGDMSLVGPRPEVRKFVDLKNPLWRKVLSVRPGLTDPVTLRLRNEEDFLATVTDKEAFYREVILPFKLRGSLEYLKNKSIKSDLGIIFETFKVIAFPQTAPPPSLEELKLSYINKPSGF